MQSSMANCRTFKFHSKAAKQSSIDFKHQVLRPRLDIKLQIVNSRVRVLLDFMRPRSSFIVRTLYPLVPIAGDKVRLFAR